MVDLVALPEPSEYRYGILNRRLFYHHRLEPALKRGVLLHILAVLVYCGRADATEIAARKGGLKHVGGVYRALGRARAHDGVHLVYEKYYPALGLLYLF